MFRAQTMFLPPPVGGLNTRDPKDMVPPTEAIILRNFYPEKTCLTLREFEFEIVDTGSLDIIKTLASFVDDTGNEVLIAAADGGIIDCTNGVGGYTVLAAAATFDDDYWQTILFGNHLILVNGDDQPQKIYDNAGTVTLAAATYTGITDDADLIQVTAYRNRLYFAATSGKIWYGGVDAVVGALTEFDIRSLMKRGGLPYVVGTWTYDDSGGLDDRFVILGLEGDLLIYEGANPAASDWKIVAHFIVPRPMGRRCIAKHGADLLILTDGGVLSLAKLMETAQAGGGISYLSDKIAPTIADYTYDYIENFEAGDLPCEIVIDQSQRKLFVVIASPSGTGSSFSSALMLVMNLETGAWCQYEGVDSSTLCHFKSEIYFAKSSENGVVFALKDVSREINLPIEPMGIDPWLVQGTAGFETPAIKRVSAIKPLLEIYVAYEDEYMPFTFHLIPPPLTASEGKKYEPAENITFSYTTTDEYITSVYSLQKTAAISAEGARFALEFYNEADFTGDPDWDDGWFYNWGNPVKYMGSMITFTVGGLE